MKLVGLTGGIASGKSTVSRILKSQNIPIIDADLIAREVVQPGRRAYQLIVKRFGRDILLPDGNIDRQKLGSIVFADPEKRKMLNQCTHQYIRFEILRQFFSYWLAGEKVTVLDAPLLIESGLDKFMNVVVVIYW
ncbi:dephospho-CoA kinase [Jimgerdemannia flammicorona]|uniref:Dephospho-CoA kinase n=2 Tax=Jimgerdemannia flammicorona TaxID=994334 RepID=A0A433PHC6_9FUNG|nr:dephospho-CoA kinase [Jimgerdemannia flammicorona]RUS16963.1 dephospho-CoA kinase [Jimgerdemannia flammicorona]